MPCARCVFITVITADTAELYHVARCCTMLHARNTAQALLPPIPNLASFWWKHSILAGDPWKARRPAHIPLQSDHEARKEAFILATSVDFSEICTWELALQRWPCPKMDTQNSNFDFDWVNLINHKILACPPLSDEPKCCDRLGRMSRMENSFCKAQWQRAATKASKWKAMTTQWRIWKQRQFIQMHFKVKASGHVR